MEIGKSDLTQEQKDWCNEYIGSNWYADKRKKVHVFGVDFLLSSKKNKIVFFPVQFADTFSFSCSSCINLEYLKGCPKKIKKNFFCTYCDKLKNFEGVPKSIAGNFFCYYCKSLESIDELKNTKIEGRIFYYNCPKLEKYDSILGDMNLFRRWQKSEYTADEFLKEYDGFLQAKKYGI